MTVSPGSDAFSPKSPVKSLGSSHLKRLSLSSRGAASSPDNAARDWVTPPRRAVKDEVIVHTSLSRRRILPLTSSSPLKNFQENLNINDALTSFSNPCSGSKSKMNDRIVRKTKAQLIEGSRSSSMSVIKKSDELVTHVTKNAEVHHNHLRGLPGISYSSSWESVTGDESNATLLANAREMSQLGKPETIAQRNTETAEDLTVVKRVFGGGENQIGKDPAERQSSGTVDRTRKNVVVGSQPTLTEAHSDLLSFIAKKERRCLDLREELKRHEEELQQLKKKWAMVAAKSLPLSASNSANHMMHTATVNPSKSKLPAALTASSNLRENHQNPYTGASAPASHHILDMSLLSATFDSNADFEPRAADPDIGDSVSAAKAWVGGVIGKVLDVVSGIDEQADSDRSYQSRSMDDRLDMLKEEEEPNERESKEMSRSLPRPSFEPGPTPQCHTGTLIDATFHERQGIGSPGFSYAQSAVSEGHTRNRSTFEILGGAAGGSWGAMTKHWSAVTESPTFKQSKRATWSLVDTFERGLTEALGPLEVEAPPMSKSTSSKQIRHAKDSVKDATTSITFNKGKKAPKAASMILAEM